MASELAQGVSVNTPPESPKTAAVPSKSTTAGQGTGDRRAILTWGYSGKALRARMILFAVISVALLALAIWKMSVPYAELACLTAIAMLWIYYAIVYFYRTMTIQYRLGDLNLTYEHGLFQRTTDTMEVMNIEDLRVTQTLWDRLINGGVGTIRIFCTSDRTHSGDSIMKGVENPHDIMEAIDRTRQERRGKRAMIQM